MSEATRDVQTVGELQEEARFLKERMIEAVRGLNDPEVFEFVCQRGVLRPASMKRVGVLIYTGRACIQKEFKGHRRTPEKLAKRLEGLRNALQPFGVSIYCERGRPGDNWRRLYVYFHPDIVMHKMMPDKAAQPSNRGHHNL